MLLTEPKEKYENLLSPRELAIWKEVNNGKELYIKVIFQPYTKTNI